MALSPPREGLIWVAEKEQDSARNYASVPLLLLNVCLFLFSFFLLFLCYYYVRIVYSCLLLLLCIIFVYFSFSPLSGVKISVVQGHTEWSTTKFLDALLTKRVTFQAHEASDPCTNVRNSPVNNLWGLSWWRSY